MTMSLDSVFFIQAFSSMLPSYFLSSLNEQTVYKPYTKQQSLFDVPGITQFDIGAINFTTGHE